MKNKKGFAPSETMEKLISNKRLFAGFTIVEVIVALMIVLIAATGIISSFSISGGYIARAGRKGLALDAFRQRAEKLLVAVNQTGWNSPANPLYAPEGGNMSYTVNLTQGEFRDKWQGSLNYTVSNTNDTSYREVAMTVNWKEPN